jgi:hypothetical protein
MKMKPQRTIELLDNLEPVGFNNADFALLHPTRLNQTINPHRRYMKMIQEIPPDGPTALIQKRLEIIWRIYKIGRRDK